MKYSLLSLLLIIGLASCTDECITCVRIEIDNTKVEREFCDDGDTKFTDQNGVIITFDEVIQEQESFGFDCN